MTIVCGLDFTANSARAARVAAILSRRAREELLAVHVVPPLPPGRAAALPAPEAVLEGLDQALTGIEKSGLEPRTELRTGLPDVEIVALAAEVQASLIVLGALGERAGEPWTLGSVADRVSQISRSPVLVVRSLEPFEEWEREKRALRVLIGVDLTPSSDAAVRWATALAALGRCELLGAHVWWPPAEREKRHLKGALPLGKGHPEIEQELEQELAARISGEAADRPIPLRLTGGLGRTADHLVQMAADERADLIVVGNHQRAGLARFWHGSVSHGVLDRARMNVACVPY